ncbi:aldose epimerase family protein [Halobacillus faecis]
MVDVCTYQKTKFKSLDAVVLENESVRAVILPGYGGKMVSFFDKEADYEWLYQTDRPKLEIPPYGADFSKYDSSGFDEMFPGIDKGPHPIDWKEIPDHGEVWTLPWEYKATHDGVSLEVHSPEFPYALKKKICLHGDGVTIKYEAINKSDEPFPFIWTPHALLNLNQHTAIEVPEDLNQVMNVEKGSQHLGDWGTTHVYPETKSAKTGSTIDLRELEPMEEGTAEKFYFTEPLSKGWCSLVQPDLNRKLTYRFPENKVPYLGVWKTRGGYRGEHNIALEPCTGVYDDVYLAEKIGKVSYIPAHGSYTWTLNIETGGL